jgi:hypothetical protein
MSLLNTDMFSTIGTLQYITSFLSIELSSSKGGRGGRGRDRIVCSGFITTYVIIAYHQ